MSYLRTRLRLGIRIVGVSTMSYRFYTLLSAICLSGCVINPLGSDSTINVYTWADRDTPFDSREATANDSFDGYFDGDTSLADLIALNPSLDQSDETPYLVEACGSGSCLHAVVFPADLSLKNDKVRGFVVLNSVSTAAYNEVASLPAAEVRSALDDIAQQVLAEDINEDGSVDYSDLVAADFRYASRAASLADAGLPQRLTLALAADEDSTIGNYLQANALNAWALNSGSDRAVHIKESNSSLGVLVNVESVGEVSSGGDAYARVRASGIPDYRVEITNDLLAFLNNRPQASGDFVSGAATVGAGDVVAFGEDIGYNSNSNSCASNEGFGYWPPGPECPEDVEHDIYLPLAPIATSTECDTGAGSVGYYVNGTSVFNWTDTQTYNSEGVWSTLAPEAELYDVDICGGHAANGEYHHHFYSQCLADLVGDTGNSHSPLYGFAADGYPIYGPWEDSGQLALSAWRARDYDNPASATGCGSAGRRTCLLVDQYDVSLGTTATDFEGPDIDGTYTSLSRNDFDTPSGFFFEDWYWDQSLSQRGGAYLDQYNGHSDATRGYHYHVTIKIVEGAIIPAFPYSVGPRFAGELQDNANANCSTGIGGPGGMGSGDAGGGPPPGGGMPPRGS